MSGLIPQTSKAMVVINILGYPGVMLSGSKMAYSKAHPAHRVFFNANIYDEDGQKIWYGDVDFDVDGANLQAVARAIGEPIYVTREQPWRFNPVTREMLAEAVKRDAEDVVLVAKP